MENKILENCLNITVKKYSHPLCGDTYGYIIRYGKNGEKYKRGEIRIDADILEHARLLRQIMCMIESEEIKPYRKK